MSQPWASPKAWCAEKRRGGISRHTLFGFRAVCTRRKTRLSSCYQVRFLRRVLIPLFGLSASAERLLFFSRFACRLLVFCWHAPEPPSIIALQSCSLQDKCRAKAVPSAVFNRTVSTLRDEITVQALARTVVSNVRWGMGEYLRQDTGLLQLLQGIENPC